MIPTKFTKEIRDNWSKNLKSGKYKQGFGGLVVDENEYNLSPQDDMTNAFYCCIGVLGDCTPGLDNFSVDGEEDPYVFLKKTIGKELMEKLYQKNDDFATRPANRDYSNVIPLIEALPVQD